MALGTVLENPNFRLKATLKGEVIVEHSRAESIVS